MRELVGTFIPERRQTIRSVDAELRPRLEMWQVENGRVQKQCHPRGAYWKTAVVELRAGPNTDREVVWLRLVDGEWWMYAL